MTLLVIEGFDHFTKDEVWRKGWNGAVFGMGAGRISLPGYVNHSMEVIANNSVFKAMPVVDEFVLGFAFNNTSQPPLWDGSNIMGFAARSGRPVHIGMDSAGYLYVTDGVDTAYGTTPIRFHVWNYVELKVSGGNLELHLNGDAEIGPVAMLPGSQFYKLVFEISSLGATCFFDDFYLCDLLGDHNNDFLGDTHIDTLYPTADGTYTDWTPLTGPDHFAMVDEEQMDDDTSYNSTVGAGDKDSFIFQDLPFGLGQVFGAQLNLGVEKKDAGLRQVKGLVRQASTDYEGPLETINTTYQFWSWTMDENPATSAPWDVSEINLDEYGIELVT